MHAISEVKFSTNNHFQAREQFVTFSIIFMDEFMYISQILAHDRYHGSI